MRFNVGDILKLRGQIDNGIRWRVERIENQRYYVTYILQEGEEWRNGNWYNEGGVRDLDLDGVQQPPAPPAQEEVTIYTVFFKANPNAPINCMSFNNRGQAESYKVSAENIGYTVVAMKKFKTRI